MGCEAIAEQGRPRRPFSACECRRAPWVIPIRGGIINLLGVLQTTMEYTGTVAVAISGAIAAGRQRMDVAGVVALACVVPVGGGTVRDLILGRPAFWVSNPSFIVVAAVVALVVIALARTPVLDFLDRYQIVEIFDAAGMALFVIVGTNIALAAGANNVSAVILGVITGVGGGFLRDIVADQIPDVLRNGQIYASAALGGGCMYVILVEFDLNVLAAFWIPIIVIFAARMLALNLGVAIPTFDYPSAGDGAERSDAASPA